MSHQPQRKEKNCLNCGTIVAGQYCQHCGQENILPKQNFGAMLKHFIYDVFHFDGKFFDTLKYLLFRPAFVPRQYIAGKRQSYLDPIRMYLFTSAVFFLVFFSVANPEDTVHMNGDQFMTRQERFEYAADVNRRMHEGDSSSALKRQLSFLLDTSYRLVLSDSSKLSGDSVFNIRFQNKNQIMFAERKTSRGVEVNMGSGWLGRQLEKHWSTFKRGYGDDTKAMLTDIVKIFLHRLPYMLFVSLPFFALLLKLLYVRKKNFYYSDHAVFTIYHYIFSFIALLFYFLLSKLYDLCEWRILDIVRALVLLSGGVYLFISMKRFYQQGFGKTLLKFIILNLLGIIVLVILFALFTILSIFQL